jgi:hypothetical protein
MTAAMTNSEALSGLSCIETTDRSGSETRQIPEKGRCGLRLTGWTHHFRDDPKTGEIGEQELHVLSGTCSGAVLPLTAKEYLQPKEI